ncbi:MAG TPA: rhodanese-like domain-containing protein [Rhodospirillales bacterium]|nr:rhodanese-like domain-containing protein [Rhodospirillales bacterium]
MSSTTARTAQDMVREALTEIETITVGEARELLGRDDVVFVDVRETVEYEQGTIPHAVHVPRGMLEWYADPTVPIHKAELRSGKRLVLFCAAGGRSALAAKTLKEMGIGNLCHIGGGFAAWKQAGLPVKR